ACSSSSTRSSTTTPSCQADENALLLIGRTTAPNSPSKATGPNVAPTCHPHPLDANRRTRSIRRWPASPRSRHCQSCCPKPRSSRTTCHCHRCRSRAGAAGLWWWNHRGTIEPPAGLASGLFSSSPSTPAPAPNTRASDSAVYTPPRDTSGLPAGGSMSSAAPALAPANSTAVSTPAVRPPTSGGTANATTTAPPASQTAPTVTAAAPPAATPAPNAIEPSSDPKVQKFDALADSLEQAIRNFQDRAADFTTKRLTCRGLGVGYEGADDAYIALAGAYRTVHTSIDSAREARFRKLSSQIGDVNNTFDASK